MKMDALKFIEERNRMCDYYKNGCEAGCRDCPAFDIMCSSFQFITSECIAVVEQWSKEHPRKTRQSVFLEQWPNCMIDDDGIVEICSRNIDKMHGCDLGRSGGCTDCRRGFWMQEVD